MTITRVVNGIDTMIKNKQQLKEEFLNLRKSWSDSDSIPITFVNSIVELLDLDINILSQFKEHLEKEEKFLLEQKAQNPRSNKKPRT